MRPSANRVSLRDGSISLYDVQKLGVEVLFSHSLLIISWGRRRE